MRNQKEIIINPHTTYYVLSERMEGNEIVYEYHKEKLGGIPTFDEIVESGDSFDNDKPEDPLLKLIIQFHRKTLRNNCGKIQTQITGED